jgi:hypothetical protein
VAEKVITFKTTSAEEVIGKLVEDSEDHVVLGSARTLMMQPVQGGGFGLGMLPFMVSADNQDTEVESDVKIYKKDIMGELINDVPKSLEDAYLSQTSKIQLM